jgi:hypothetical protein
MNYVARQSVGEETTAVLVAMRDGRRADLPGWQSCGFELMAHDSVVSDWDDEQDIARLHYPEMEALARHLTGCDHALVSGHIRRNPEEAARHADLGPIAFVHSDFAASYGDLIRRHYGQREAEADRADAREAQHAMARAGIDAEAIAAARRLVILQFWRNTGPARMDLPIAFCDARTVPAEDLRVLPVRNYAGGGFDFETLAVVAPEDPARHHWYTYPAMQRSEVVAFRTYDSERVPRVEPFWTPHSAFEDPAVPRGRPSRRSIELRATCLFR